MHNLHNDEYAREVTQPDKTRTQLVAIGGCGQGFGHTLILTLYARKIKGGSTATYSIMYSNPSSLSFIVCHGFIVFVAALT